MIWHPAKYRGNQTIKNVQEEFFFRIRKMNVCMIPEIHFPKESYLEMK